MNRILDFQTIEGEADVHDAARVSEHLQRQPAVSRLAEHDHVGQLLSPQLAGVRGVERTERSVLRTPLPVPQ